MDPLQYGAGTLWNDTVRPVTPGDVPALKALVDATGLFPSVLLDDMLGPYLAQATVGPIWLTAGNSSPAAVAYCAPEHLTSGTWNLYLIAVHPDRQQHGIGRALIANIERLLSAKGERLLLVETSGLPMFQGTSEFYARCGFEEEARIRDFYQDGEDKIVFRKQISTLATKVGGIELIGRQDPTDHVEDQMTG
jgi:ribosomal protein S18 acetylase RimI-like enzyme